MDEVGGSDGTEKVLLVLEEELRRILLLKQRLIYVEEKGSQLSGVED